LVQLTLDVELPAFCDDRTVQDIISKTRTEEPYLKFYSNFYAASTVEQVVQLLHELNGRTKFMVSAAVIADDANMFEVYRQVNNLHD
jgi:hypothetical protein